MNKNIAILIVLILTFLTSYFLYWKGELALEDAAKDFTVLAFENTSLVCDYNSLTFFIENNLEEELPYQISISADDKTLETLAVSVLAQNKKLIQPKSETLEFLCAQSQKIKYEVMIENKTNKQSIYKLINP